MRWTSCIDLENWPERVDGTSSAESRFIHMVRKVLQTIVYTTRLMATLAALTRTPTLRNRAMETNGTGAHMEMLTSQLTQRRTARASAEPRGDAAVEQCEHWHPATSTTAGTTAFTRYGNQYGQYSRCALCQGRWEWSDVAKDWEYSPDVQSSSRLPVPSSTGSASTANRTPKTIPSGPSLRTAASRPTAKATATAAPAEQPPVRAPPQGMMPGSSSNHSNDRLSPAMLQAIQAMIAANQRLSQPQVLVPKATSPVQPEYLRMQAAAQPDYVWQQQNMAHREQLMASEARELAEARAAFRMQEMHAQAAVNATEAQFQEQAAWLAHQAMQQEQNQAAAEPVPTTPRVPMSWEQPDPTSPGNDF